jgi:hypothetical protein
LAWKLTIRTGPRVEHARFDGLDDVLDAVEARGRELAESAGREPVDVKLKRFEPIQQVVARLEFSGPQRLIPSVTAGVDVRGDGSIEAYTGRVKRQVVDQRDGESAYGALRRELSAR